MDAKSVESINKFNRCLIIMLNMSFVYVFIYRFIDESEFASVNTFTKTLKNIPL